MSEAFAERWVYSNLRGCEIDLDAIASSLADALDRRHLCAVVPKRRARDLFRKTYWSKCWRCGDERGPYLSEHVELQRELHETAECGARRWLPTSE